jgi:hypothetical protein
MKKKLKNSLNRDKQIIQFRFQNPNKKICFQSKNNKEKIYSNDQEQVYFDTAKF